MLVLTRKAGEQIQIGDDITVEVMCIKRGGCPAVRIGITAPGELNIVRTELLEQPGGDDLTGNAEGQSGRGESVRHGGPYLQDGKGLQEVTHADAPIPPVPQLVERIRALEGQL